MKANELKRTLFELNDQDMTVAELRELLFESDRETVDCREINSRRRQKKEEAAPRDAYGFTEFMTPAERARRNACHRFFEESNLS